MFVFCLVLFAGLQLDLEITNKSAVRRPSCRYGFGFLIHFELFVSTVFDFAMNLILFKFDSLFYYSGSIMILIFVAKA